MWYNDCGHKFLRFVTIHAFDRQTDGQTDGQKGLAMSCVVLHAVAR